MQMMLLSFDVAHEKVIKDDDDVDNDILDSCMRPKKGANDVAQ